MQVGLAQRNPTLPQRLVQHCVSGDRSSVTPLRG
jgi:hypothetical protein